MKRLLQESLSLQPLIKENLFPQSYLGLVRLHEKFSGLGEKFFSDMWQRLDIDSFPQMESPICASVKVPNLFPEREKRMLSRSLFPSVYGIVLKKVETVGAKMFLKPYVRLAITDPEYLGYRFTVLVSFIEMWPKIESDEKLKFLWVDRLTEFLMLSFNSAPSNYSLSKFESTEELTFQEVFKLVLARPGYFGQHLIYLAAVKRFEKELLKAEMQELLAKAAMMAKIQYPEAEDFVTINAPKVDDETIDLQKTISNYLQQGPDEPHLFIFADAMAQLWDHAGENEKHWIASNFARFMRR